MIPYKHLKFLAKLGLLGTAIGIAYTSILYMGKPNIVEETVGNMAEAQLDLPTGTIDELVVDLTKD